MAAASIASTVTAATSTASTVASAVDKNTLANNFTTFLTLLTTQLKNQNPLDPLDTNQFTQQLVQFSQVEQQMKSNDQLAQLVTIEKTAQSTAALAYLGSTVAIDGATTKLQNNAAAWSLTTSKPTNATITIKDAATGQTAYTGNFAINAGTQAFSWDGRGNDGKLWADGNYTLIATGVDASGQTSAISTEIRSTVDSVDVSQNPPLLNVAGQNYTFDKVRRIIRPGA